VTAQSHGEEGLVIEPPRPRRQARRPAPKIVSRRLTTL
jgi:hypothetical protein